MILRSRRGILATLPLFIALLGLCALFPSSAATAEEAGRYIVVFEDSVDRPGNLARAQTAERDGKLGFVYRHALKGYSAELSKGAVQALRNDPKVAYVEPDVRGGVAAQTVPTGIDRIFAPGNEALNVDGKDGLRTDVDVAVFDTGIDDEHPDLDVVSQVNCNGSPSCVPGGDDGYGHGTHVAGTIAAIDNGEGVVGIAPGARLWSVKVLDNGGFGSLSEFIAGIDWVTATRKDPDPENDIDVTNASLRYFTTSSAAMTEALKESVEAGIIPVVAAGNESEPVKYVPGNDPYAITVSALADYDGQPGGSASSGCAPLGADDALASFSNFGNLVEVTAPGVCIRSTLPGGAYGSNSGTSMASPHVAGAAAILASRLNPDSLQDVVAIRDTIVNEGNSGWNDTSGDGIQEPLLDVSNEEEFAPSLSEIASPSVETEPATKVRSPEATLNATVNPEGLVTTYQFEYGTTTAYGSKAPASPKGIGAGTSNLKVSETIGGLLPKTTYHFRIVATNSLGTTFGEDREFTVSEPGYPHGDENPENWQSVALTVPGTEEKCVGGAAEPPCPFNTSSVPWNWRVDQTGFSEPYLANCYGGMVGRFGGAGLVILTDAWLTEAGWVPMCRDQEIEGAPQYGIICKHIPTGEYWLKQKFDFNGSLYNIPAGTSYGFVYGEDIEGEGGIQNIIFGEEYGWDFTRYAEFSEGEYSATWDHKVLFDLYNEMSVRPTATADGGPGSCGWPVL